MGVLVTAEDGPLSSVTYYTCIYCMNLVSTIYLGYRRIYAGSDAYVRFTPSSDTGMAGVILVLSNMYVSDSTATLYIERYNGTEWEIIAEKQFTVPSTGGFQPFDIAFDTEIPLTGGVEHRVRLRVDSGSVGWLSFYTTSNDITDKAAVAVYGTPTQTGYDGSSAIIVRHSNTLDLESVGGETTLYYTNRYYSRQSLLVWGGTLTVTRDSPATISFDGWSEVALNGTLRFGTETEPLRLEDRKTLRIRSSTNTLYGGLSIGRPGNLITYHTVSRHMARILEQPAANQVRVEGDTSTWAGAQVLLPLRTSNRSGANFLYTVQAAEYDPGTDTTLLTLDRDTYAPVHVDSPDMPGYASLFDPVLVLDGVTGYAYLQFYRRDGSQARVSVRLRHVTVQYGDFTEDSYMVFEYYSSMSNLARAGTIVLFDRNVIIGGSARIERLVGYANLGYPTLNYATGTWIGELILYNTYNGIYGNMGIPLVIGRVYALYVYYVISLLDGLRVLDIESLHADNCSYLFYTGFWQGTGRLIRIGRVKVLGTMTSLGRIYAVEVGIGRLDGYGNITVPRVGFVSDIVRGYALFRVGNIDGLPGTGVYTDGLIYVESVGQGLPDGTVRTGERAVKITKLVDGTAVYRYAFPVTGEDKPFTLRLYYKGDLSIKVRVTMPDGTVYETGWHAPAGDWAPVNLAGNTTGRGQALVEYILDGPRDGVIYIDDEILLPGYIIDLSGAETWANGLPVYPPLQVTFAPLQLWLVPVSALTDPSTIGGHIAQTLTTEIEETRTAATKARDAAVEARDAAVEARDRAGEAADRIRRHDAKLDAYRWTM